MDRLSILHAFENESTFLVHVPLHILTRSTAGESAPASRAGSHHQNHPEDEYDHNGFMSANSLTAGSTQCRSDLGREKVLSVMHVLPINGSVEFHQRFLDRCETYCQLCRRLQRAVESVLQRQTTDSKSSGSAININSLATDIDCLSHLIVYPLEPTVFLAAAFALPLLVSVVSALSDGEPTRTELRALSPPAPSPSPSKGVYVVPYCFFYGFPGRRLLRGSRVPGERRGMTFSERFISVANATGICGGVPPTDNTLRSRNATRSGLTLAAYLKGCLPRSVLCVDGKTESTDRIDLLSRWSDDVLWRLFSALVSALAVVHTAGFHFCGELSPEDVLCFAIPSGYDAAETEETLFCGQRQQERVASSFGQRLAVWTAASLRHWVITEMTPAHHAFFMFSTLPRSLFTEDSQDSSVIAAAQYRDIAAVGRILLSVLEEVKLRRGGEKANSCMELLFVAERMVAVETGNRGDGDISADGVLANRFAQLQVIRLRTHLWVLRKVIEERDAQLATAIMNHKTHTESDSNITGNGITKSTKGVSDHLTPSSPVRNGEEINMAKLRERERLLTEREEKLNRFLLLYELTAERLDQLPVGKDSFDRLKQSLQQTPPAKRAANLTPSDTPKRRQQHQQDQRATRNLAVTETSPHDKACRPSRQPCPSRDGDTVFISSPSPVTVVPPINLPLHSSMSPFGNEKKQPDSAQQKLTSRSALEVSPQRTGVTLIPSTSLQVGWRGLSQTLVREGGYSSLETPSSHMVQRQNTFPSKSFGHVASARDEKHTAAYSSALGKQRARKMMSVRAARSSSAEQSVHVTPTRGAHHVPHADSAVSRLQTPSLSPSVRVTEGSSSPFLSAREKSLSQSSRIQLSSTRSKTGTSHLNIPPPPPATFVHLRSSISPNPASSAGGKVDSIPVSTHFSSSTGKAKSSRSEPSLNAGDPRDGKTPTANAAAAISGGLRTASSLLVDSETRKYDGINNKSVSVQEERTRNKTTLQERENISETSDRKNHMILTNMRTPTSHSPRAKHTSAFSAVTPNKPVTIGASLNIPNAIDKADSNSKLRVRPQEPEKNRSRPSQEIETGETPRTMRSRFAHDGWVGHHLAELEQLRHDFHHTETVKSVRNTPNGKTSARGGKCHASGEVEPFL